MLKVLTTSNLSVLHRYIQVPFENKCFYSIFAELFPNEMLLFDICRNISKINAFIRYLLKYFPEKMLCLTGGLQYDMFNSAVLVLITDCAITRLENPITLNSDLFDVFTNYQLQLWLESDLSKVLLIVLHY